jgi:hypothetical protein
MLKSKVLATALAVATMAVGAAQAATVEVVDTVTGAAGDWVHEFTVINNLEFKQLYFFGVKLEDRDIVGTPSPFNPNATDSWSNAPYGGSNTSYNNIWIDFTNVNGVLPGGSLGGFKVHDTHTVAQADIQFFAYAFTAGSPDYNGPDCFHCGFNPAFEGVASGADTGGVPEPATWALMIAGFGSAGAALRRRRALAAA